MGRPLVRLAGAAALGVIHALCFAPEPLPALMLPWLQLLAFGVLCLVAWRASTPRAAALAGVAFGLGHFMTGISWIYVSLHDYAYMAAPFAAMGVFLLSAYLSLFPALALGLARWLASPWLRGPPGRWTALACAAATAAAWTSVEWLRGVLFTGFPWLNAGYAHVDGPLHGWAPLVGVYGVAFAATLVAGACAAAWMVRHKLAAWPALAVAVVVLALGTLLARVEWVTPAGAPLEVRLVQGNIPLSDKFDPAEIWGTMTKQRELGEAPRAGGPADVTLMPETAVPVFQDQLAPEAWEEWTGSAGKSRSIFITGVALRDVTPTGEAYYNGVIQLDADTPAAALIDGKVPRYSKRHLVPFGEFIPWGFRWFVDMMVMPLGDFNRGPARQQPFDVAGQHIALNICYEDVFGEELLPAIRPTTTAPGATILANISNLAWFGDSLALPQHLQMSRMRVRETGRPMLRATNTGMTAVVDAGARVVSALPPLTVGVLDAQVQGTRGLTPYVRTGNAPILVLAFLLLGLFAWRPRAQARPSGTSPR